MFSALFRALNATGVRYVVAGGVATVLHGYARLTADVDLVIDLSVFLRPLGKARPCLMTTERDQPNV